MALELAERKIRVNAVCPGGVATAIFVPVGGELSAEVFERTPEIVEPWLAEGLPIGRSGFPVDIAHATLWLAMRGIAILDGNVFRKIEGIV